MFLLINESIHGSKNLSGNNAMHVKKMIPVPASPSVVSSVSTSEVVVVDSSASAKMKNYYNSVMIRDKTVWLKRLKI